MIAGDEFLYVGRRIERGTPHPIPRHIMARAMSPRWFCARWVQCKADWLRWRDRNTDCAGFYVR